VTAIPTSSEMSGRRARLEQAAFFYIFSSQKGKDEYIYQSYLYSIKVLSYIHRLVLRHFDKP
jgi:hypothetical protein